VSPVGWCLHNILLSWCSTKEIGVSNRLVPTSFVTVGWCLQTFIKIIFLWFSPARVSKLNYVYCDLSLHAFIVLKLMND
jgi:hypothetical protein